MIKYTFFILAFSLFFFQSCNEDSFSQVVVIDIPEHAAKPTINFAVEANHPKQLSAFISNSKGVLDPQADYKTPSDAIVNFFRNGDLLTQLKYDEESSYYKDTDNVIIRDTAGDVYLLEAKLEGFDMVSATQIMPAKPIITNATFELNGTIDSDGQRADETVVDIIDPDPNETNYFSITLYATEYYIDPNGGTIEQNQNLYLSSNDPLLTPGGSARGDYSLLFTDKSFPGGSFQIRASTYSYLQEEPEITVEILTLTKDTYLYLSSLEQYYNADGNPFAEPVTVHNNIEGGYGFFTLTNSTILKIQ